MSRYYYRQFEPGAELSGLGLFKKAAERKQARKMEKLEAKQQGKTQRAELRAQTRSSGNDLLSKAASAYQSIKGGGGGGASQISATDGGSGSAGTSSNIYLYVGLAVVAAILLYFLILKPKK